MLAKTNRLFFAHLNDNDERWDLDMISGTVHFWHWLELLYTLDRVGYDGWFGGDINSKHIGPVEAYDTNTRMIRRMIDLLRRMDPEKIASFIKKDGGVAETFNYLTQCLMAKGV